MVKKQFGVSSTVEHLTTASNQTVPSGIRGCWVTLIGCGGGGGSGYKSTSAIERYGGGGGGGGAAIYNQWVSASLLGSTYTATVPAAPSGGAAQTLYVTPGNPGSKAADVTFATGSITLTASSGFGGEGGLTTAQSIGANSGGPVGDIKGGAGGYVSSANSLTSSWPEYGEYKYAAGAGGGFGGFIQSGGANYTGILGAGVLFHGYSAVQYDTATGIGVNGPSTPQGITGPGGSGSRSTMTSTYPTGKGGDALGYGGGGGGSGASGWSSDSGAGGMGGPGYCRIIWDFI